MKGTRFTAVLLIIIGSLLLLDQMDVFYLSGQGVAIFFSFLVGFLFFRRGLMHEHRRGILLGTFLISCALWMTAIELHFLSNADPVYVGMILLSLGLAFFVSFSFRTNKPIYIFWGILFGVTGGLIFLTHLRFIPVWRLEDIMETYWPLALVFLGLTLLSDRYFLKVKNSH
jgi:hypothetical protein